MTLRRIELIAVDGRATSDRVAALEAALREAPRHCPIRRAHLARSASQRHGWTHVWEQDHDSAASLDAYMGDAYHWTVIDPFFDATNPSAIVDRVTVVTYDMADAAGHVEWPDSGIRRLLLIRCDDTASADAVGELHDAIAAGGARLPLSAWRLATALPHATHRWSMIWEQLFDDDAALTEYMRHPYHWTVVDPYFDPEHPRCIVASVTMAYYRLPLTAPG